MSRRTALLSWREEAIVRLVKQLGMPSLDEMLSAWRARPLSAQNLRLVLQKLVEYGWINQGRKPGLQGHQVAAWSISEEARPHLANPARLPLRPEPCTPLKGQSTQGEVALPRTREHMRSNWVPPPAAPMRDGALDFLRCPSLGPTAKARPC